MSQVGAFAGVGISVELRLLAAGGDDCALTPWEAAAAHISVMQIGRSGERRPEGNLRRMSELDDMEHTSLPADDGLYRPRRYGGNMEGKWGECCRVRRWLDPTVLL